MVRYLRRDWDATASWPMPRLRADLDARPFPQDFVRKTKTHDGRLGEIRARWFVPPDAAPDRVLLYFHGGSYAYGSPWTTHADVVARLALASGVTAVAIGYRLAPEHPFPAQLEDARAAFRALVAEGTAPEHVVVAGDSAGGNLAIELQLALRDAGEAQAAGAVLVSPWSDLRMPGRSFEDNDAYDYGTRAVLARHAGLFAGDVALGDPRISPVAARLAGLAPVLLVVGEVEIPRDDILALGRKLEDEGVDVTVHLARDMPHNPPVLAAYHPNGARAVEEAARFVKRRLGLDAPRI